MILTPYLLTSEQWAPEFAGYRDQILSGLGQLGAQLAPSIREELAGVLEIVNSYYSNAMEGNPTRVGQIFEAREGQVAASITERNFQLEHLAHLRASHWMRLRLRDDPSLSPAEPSFLQDLHREFYSALPESMRTAVMGSGEKIVMVPGQWRSLPATVGRFQALEPDKIAAGMMELAQAYDAALLAPRDRLTALAASHHRFLWIHPFPDGNGRVVRLFTEAMALRLGFAGHSLYSISRGLARRRSDYDAALSAADAPRHNDLDGRGNLSLKGLAAFCEFFADIMSDQIKFMTKLLERDALLDRLKIQLHSWEATRLISSTEAKVILHLFKAGEIRRGDIQAIAHVERRQVSRIAASLVKSALVSTPSSKGPLRLHFNRDLTRALLPEFFE